ncbi:pantetheine-phosphate adenylyltransferase [Euryarchaeota archaeon SM23-78]|nr:MAG: pantetheine-phosphate adenylyltransferase [Euryarchaeota archaeon SM23-78]MBW3001352.1 pantetheine-phosphate adenylyltransferase [Candidatus Woesearchaeota archaeon]
MRIAVYGGSFDPPTNGHLWVMKQGIKLFDKLYVAAAINPEKKCDFTINKRVEMLEELTIDSPNAIVNKFENKYLVDYAKSVEANYILRGLRTEEDYEYEYKMRHFNRKLNPKIETLFLMPPKEIEDISSSFVKGLVGPEGWEDVVKELVPQPVYKIMLEHYKHKRTKRNL